MATMYDKLLQLSLFQGLTLNELTKILEKVTFLFENYKAGDVIINEGDPCKRVAFLLDGEIQKKTVVKGDHPLEVKEWIAAPFTFELSSLYGRQTTYRSTYIASADSNIMWMHKRFLMEELNIYPIIDMNYRNLISAQVQTLNDYLWGAPASSEKGHFARFLLQHLEQPQGQKVFYVQRADLAAFLNESFFKTSQLLIQMQREGLLTYERGRLILPDAALLKDLAYPI